MKLVTLYILAMPFALLDLRRRVGDADSAATYQAGPHGLSEVLYNFASAGNNNGSAFAYQGTGHAVVHDHPGHRDADRPVLPDHPGARDRRLAGRASRRCPTTSGTLPTHTPLFGVLVAGVDRHRRRPHVLPGARAGPDPRAPVAVRTERHHDCNTATPADAAPAEGAHARQPATTSIFDPAIVTTAVRRRAQEAQPAHDDAQPGDVHRRGRLGADHVLFIRDFGDSDTQQNVFAGLVAAVAVVHRAVRQLRRGDGRGPRQGAGRRAAQDAGRHDGHGPAARRHDRREAVVAAASRRPVRRRRRRGDPRRRRGRRGHRHRRRVGDHRRVGAGHPRVRRRPLGGHRRHPGAQRRDRRAHHGQARARRSSTG